MYAEFLGVWPEGFFNWNAPDSDKSKTHLLSSFKKKQTWENWNSFLVKTATDRKQKFGKETHTIEMCVTLLSENLIWLAFECSYFINWSWNWTHVPILGLDSQS